MGLAAVAGMGARRRRRLSDGHSAPPHLARQRSEKDDTAHRVPCFFDIVAFSQFDYSSPRFWTTGGPVLEMAAVICR
jgi:hypothetical protein